ncbi:hypothetical protein RI129_000102 [Pyrocoelia pectoralis]|uniref:MAU2 chromatid cohesion factor homolog n=1 Tax=Pyrocoelia pectoralis TaxID=417401 RepID=A0AAN7UWR7_9COLE
MASSQDAWYLSLLGLAEYFRTSTVFNFKPPPRVEARTHLQLGNILLTHTKNIDLAKTHLEQAVTIPNFFISASVLAELYEQQKQLAPSKHILRRAVELSQHNVYWHCRLIFQLAQVHASEKDYQLASSLLGVGVDYAHISSASYTRVLFLLSKAMLLLIDKKLQEVQPVLNQAGHLIETWTGSVYQKEYLKVFFLVLQVTLYKLIYRNSFLIIREKRICVIFHILNSENYYFCKIVIFLLINLHFVNVTVMCHNFLKNKGFIYLFPNFFQVLRSQNESLLFLKEKLQI